MFIPPHSAGSVWDPEEVAPVEDEAEVERHPQPAPWLHEPERLPTNTSVLDAQEPRQPSVQSGVNPPSPPPRMFPSPRIWKCKTDTDCSAVEELEQPFPIRRPKKWLYLYHWDLNTSATYSNKTVLTKNTIVQYRGMMAWVIALLQMTSCLIIIFTVVSSLCA